MHKTIILLLLLVLLCYFCMDSKFSVSFGRSKEGMAPLGTGSYKNTISEYGKCNKALSENNKCSVGNCPMESTITNDRFCNIQCAQDPDPEIRKQCMDYCMDMMNNGCR